MFEQALKNIDDVLRKEAGCTAELDYTEQTSWVLFLKCLDGLNQDRAMEARLDGKKYSFIPDKDLAGKAGQLQRQRPPDRPPQSQDRGQSTRLRERKLFPTCKQKATGPRSAMPVVMTSRL